MTTASSSPLDIRISGALNALMTIYNVPEEIRKVKLEKVFAMDYRSLGKQVLREFREYVEQAIAAAERMRKNITRYITVL